MSEVPQAVIAAVNGPNAVVLSGTQASVEALADRLAQEGRRVHRLAVSHAFHSPLMQPMVAEFSAAMTGIEVGAPRIGLVSNVTGRLAGAGYGSPEYWAAHVGQPVRFFDGVRAAEAAGAELFVELGPGAALTAAVDQSLSAERAISVPRLHRLASVYQVPVDQLLPRDAGDPRSEVAYLDLTQPASPAPRKVVIDLGRLDDIGGPTGEMLRRYLAMIQVQRQDFNGRVLTIRRDDLRAIACILDTPPDHASERLEQLGMLFTGAPILANR